MPDKDAPDKALDAVSSTSIRKKTQKKSQPKVKKTSPEPVQRESKVASEPETDQGPERAARAQSIVWDIELDNRSLSSFHGASRSGLKSGSMIADTRALCWNSNANEEESTEDQIVIKRPLQKPAVDTKIGRAHV